jgi:hypothetical protein
MAKLLGSVDLLGLNSFGENRGMNPLWGIAVGGGVSSVTQMVLARGSGKAATQADLIGFLAGLGAGGVMWSMKSTRHAAFGAFAGAFFASGMKWLERVLFGSAASKPVAGVGYPAINALNGLGYPAINALNGGGGGMGYPAISRESIPAGTIPGVAGPQMSGGIGQPPVSLLGQRLGAGGPQVSGLSARYGATLMGGR